MTNPRLTDEQRRFLRTQPAEYSKPDRVGTRIRLALKLIGINQTRLGDQLGVINQQVSRYVAGSDVKLSTAFRIADALGADICDLWAAPKVRASKSKAAKRRGAHKRIHAKGNGPKAEVAAGAAA